MPQTPPLATTPPRRRDHQSYSWNYEHYGNNSPRHPYGYHGNPSSAGYPRGPPSYFAPPPSQYPPPGDHYGYEPSPRGYWGSPPSYESYPPPPGDRSMPPPNRGPFRGPIRQSLSHEDSSQPAQYMSRPPQSPGAYCPGPPSLRPKLDEFLPPSPPQASPDVKEKSIDEQEKDEETSEGASSGSKKKKDSDPLSVLANVSAGMNDKGKKKKDQEDKGKDQEEAAAATSDENRTIIPMPAPTSPLQRRSKPSPITPNTTSPGNNKTFRHAVTPARSLSHASSWDYGPDYGMETPPTPSYYPPGHRYPGYPEHPPALIEQRSFESQGSYYSADRAQYGVPQPPPHHYEDNQGHHGYWEGPQTPYTPRYGYEQPWGGYPDRHDMTMGDPYYRGPPPPPPGMPYPSPYTAVQQPRLEEKTVLRKKFSWKHYPELERFLISNRDEYLKHSNMNYTAEQKRYNNWLTERLLEVAGQHHYVFDPEEFNFVAIRDRIRCYYKSYVQTARKRGIKLPIKKKE